MVFYKKVYCPVYTTHKPSVSVLGNLCINLFQSSKSISWEYIEFQVCSKSKNIFFVCHGNFQNLKISGWLIKSEKLVKKRGAHGVPKS